MKSRLDLGSLRIETVQARKRPTKTNTAVVTAIAKIIDPDAWALHPIPTQEQIELAHARRTIRSLRDDIEWLRNAPGDAERRIIPTWVQPVLETVEVDPRSLAYRRQKAIEAATTIVARYVTRKPNYFALRHRWRGK